jgi:hypothetical protein
MLLELPLRRRLPLVLLLSLLAELLLPLQLISPVTKTYL